MGHQSEVNDEEINATVAEVLQSRKSGAPADSTTCGGENARLLVVTQRAA